MPFLLVGTESGQTTLWYCGIGALLVLQIHQPPYRTSIYMIRSQVDRCLLYHRNGGVLSAVVVPRVNDRIIAGSDAFLRVEDEKAMIPLSKKKKRSKEESTFFNGAEFSVLSYDMI